MPRIGLGVELGRLHEARMEVDGSLRRTVDPDEYSQKHASSQVVAKVANDVGADAIRVASER
jgi:hypothetical protein